MTPVSELTQGEIERMRQIVNQHDSKTKNSLKVMDPNNPPKEPYKFQKFPQTLYNHKNCEPAHDKVTGVRVGDVVTERKTHVPARHHTLIVHSEAELARALKDGWSETPPEVVSADATRAEEADAAPAKSANPRKAKTSQQAEETEPAQ